MSWSRRQRRRGRGHRRGPRAQRAEHGGPGPAPVNPASELQPPRGWTGLEHRGIAWPWAWGSRLCGGLGLHGTQCSPGRCTVGLPCRQGFIPCRQPPISSRADEDFARDLLLGQAGMPRCLSLSTINSLSGDCVSAWYSSWWPESCSGFYHSGVC